MSRYQESAGTVRRLLEETVRAFVVSNGVIVAHEAHVQPVRASNAEVVLHTLSVQPPASSEPTDVQLVTKWASAHERRVLRLLGKVAPDRVPFSFSLGDTSSEHAWLCLQDLGRETRPTSLEPVDLAIFDSEASGLAHIHAAFLGRTHELAWLPRLDRDYFERCIHEWFWRPAWERAVANNDFRAEFRDQIEMVEQAASSIVSEMTALNAEQDAHTLVHADLHPSNELIYNGVVHFIDWETARVGTWYLDVPHMFCTLELAERYRMALGRHGVGVPRDDFEARYRVAARYTALRYMWWALHGWQEDRSLSVWVRHYFDRLKV